MLLEQEHDMTLELEKIRAQVEQEQAEAAEKAAHKKKKNKGGGGVLMPSKTEIKEHQLRAKLQKIRRMQRGETYELLCTGPRLDRVLKGHDQ